MPKFCPVAVEELIPWFVVEAGFCMDRLFKRDWAVVGAALALFGVTWFMARVPPPVVDGGVVVPVLFDVVDCVLGL